MKEVSNLVIAGLCRFIFCEFPHHVFNKDMTVDISIHEHALFYGILQSWNFSNISNIRSMQCAIQGVVFSLQPIFLNLNIKVLRRRNIRINNKIFSKIVTSFYVVLCLVCDNLNYTSFFNLFNHLIRILNNNVTFFTTFRNIFQLHENITSSSC